MKRPSLAAVALPVALLGFVPIAALASEVDLRVERPPGDQRVWAPAVGIFTATSDEVLVTLTRLVSGCPNAAETCSSDAQCGSNFCHSGQCVYPESLRIASIMLVYKGTFCAAAACGNNLPAECVGSVCNGGACSDPTSWANAMCQCLSCNDIPPFLGPTDMPFYDTFDDGPDARYVLTQAAFTGGPGGYLSFTRPTYDVNTGTLNSPWVGLAQIHLFGLLPGEGYALIVKWSPIPYPAAITCQGPDQLSIHLEPVASVCAP